jgi:hypothetical protein
MSAFISRILRGWGCVLAVKRDRYEEFSLSGLMKGWYVGWHGCGRRRKRISGACGTDPEKAISCHLIFIGVPPRVRKIAYRIKLSKDGKGRKQGLDLYGRDDIFCLSMLPNFSS